MSISESQSAAVEGRQHLEDAPVNEVLERWKEVDTNHIQKLFDQLLAAVADLREGIPETMRASEASYNGTRQARERFMAANSGVAIDPVVFTAKRLEERASDPVMSGLVVQKKLETLQQDLAVIFQTLPVIDDTVTVAREAAQTVVELRPVATQQADAFIQRLDP